MTIPPVVRAIGASALVVALASASACSSSGDRSNATTTSAVPGTVASTSTSTSAPASPSTSPPTSSTTVPPTTAPTGDAAGMQFAVYWTRAMGDPRVVDIAGYTDPVGQPHAYVLFGSVVNPGPGAVERPAVKATWRPAGAPPVTVTGRVLAPDGTDLALLPAGGSADVLVVVDQQSLAGVVNDATPELYGTVR